ncbi:MAG: cobyrinic acid a,c-diamide synthase, partial [Chloroflexota bacterium]
RVGVLQDKAFTFYYPENLAALEAAGAELVTISPLADKQFPAVDALYAGGGFPEMHVAELSANQSFRESLAQRIAEGLPVWAECGGLMYLSRAIVMDGTAHPMVGALPVVVEHQARPQGHGYVEARVTGDNPFLPLGTTLRGHEFHYSRLQVKAEAPETILSLTRGTGIGDGRDGIRVREVVASYLHLHALGQPEWAPALVRAASGRRSLDRAGGMC